MWVGDQDWVECPRCRRFGVAVILTIESREDLRIRVRCTRCRTEFSHTLQPMFRRYLEPPKPPPQPITFTVCHAKAKDGPLIRCVEVPFRIADRVAERRRREYPDCWVFICGNGERGRGWVPLNVQRAKDAWADDWNNRR